MSSVLSILALWCVGAGVQAPEPGSLTSGATEGSPAATAPTASAPAAAGEKPDPVAASPTPAPEAPAAADDQGLKLPDWLSRVELSGVLWPYYQYDLSPGGKDVHVFSIGRAYLTTIVKPLDHVRLKMTLDAPEREPSTSVKNGVTTVKDGVGRYDIVLKHAYGEVYDLFLPGLALRLGMQDMPLVPSTEKIWGYRFQGSVLSDREKYLTSTDLGVGILYQMPAKWLEAHLVLVNGETWSKAEVSKHKDAQGRLTVRPLASTEMFAGLALSVGGNVGVYEAGKNQDRHRLFGSVSFEHKYAALGVEYLRTWDPPSKLEKSHQSLVGDPWPIAKGAALSAYAWLDLGLVGAPEGLRLVARFDSVDSDARVKQNDHRREIFGLGYRANKYVNVLLDAELTQYDAAGDRSKNQTLIALHTAIGF